MSEGAGDGESLSVGDAPLPRPTCVSGGSARAGALYKGRPELRSTVASGQFSRRLQRKLPLLASGAFG